MAGQKNERAGKKKAWNADVPGDAGHSPALAWLSLVGMLPSRARLRFTRPRHYILCIQPADAKPAKRAHRLTTIHLRQTPFIHLPVLTRPSVAGFNAPRDTAMFAGNVAGFVPDTPRGRFLTHVFRVDNSNVLWELISARPSRVNSL